MNIRVSYLLLILLLGACSSTPLTSNNQATNTQQPIVNQADDAATEARFSQNLNDLMTQVAQTQQIPLA